MYKRQLKPGAVRRILDVLTQQGLVTPDLVPVVGREKYFSLPDEVFHLDLGCAAIAVYAFLLYRENRKTYQCTLSYKTIGNAIGASNNTVRKHVLELEEAGLISTDRTVVIDASGRKRNGNLRYTIHPIQNAVELHHQRQLAALDAAVTLAEIEDLYRPDESDSRSRPQSIAGELPVLQAVHTSSPRDTHAGGLADTVPDRSVPR